ncbi:hypothetical protein A3Q40_02967 [Rhodococcus sp. PBTS 1]|nr:hypothetical protein A3Q40_02967 [Rhodococcus sp. PBTS 1]
MARNVARKNFEWPQAFSDEMAERRLDWNLDDPSRVRARQGLTSENTFVIAMLKLALESLDQPRSSRRLWEIVQEIELAKHR